MPPPRRARTTSPRAATAAPRKSRKRAVPAPEAPSQAPRGVEAWFAERGWTPFAFQREAWAAQARGESGLIHVPTGAGKTYAAYIGPLEEVAARGEKGLQQTLKRHLPSPTQISRGQLASVRPSSGQD